MQRREAREFVLSVLYRREFVETPLADLLDEVDTGDQRSYVERVYLGILDRRAELDALIGERTVGWRFERLALIDRNILRLGAFEILYLPEVPPQVALDEAVELAKKYGTENARSFINGILDRIWKESGRYAGAERAADCRGAPGEAGATGEGPRGEGASA
jgi:N utilization substance protein B